MGTKSNTKIDHFSNSGEMVICLLLTFFFSCDRVPLLTLPLSLPSLSSSRIFCACDSEGEDCCPSCSSMITSASVSAGSGAGCSDAAAFSTVGEGTSAGGASSVIFSYHLPFANLLSFLIVIMQHRLQLLQKSIGIDT